MTNPKMCEGCKSDRQTDRQTHIRAKNKALFSKPPDGGSFSV